MYLYKKFTNTNYRVHAEYDLISINNNCDLMFKGLEDMATNGI